MVKQNSNAYVVEWEEDGRHMICRDCWMEIENRARRTFGLPTRQSLWSYCRRHLYRRGNTTDRGIDATSRVGGVVGLGVRLGNTITPIKGGYVVGIPIHSGNTSSAGRGGDVVGLGVVASSIGSGSVGMGHGSGSITLLEVINDCMSPQPSDNREEKNEPPATHGPRSSTFSH
ncbi:hypothetical protein Tco_0723958 [Tanacetum coccineum]